VTIDEDGTMVVVYGGYLWNSTIAGDLWVLDVINGAWSQGLSGPKRRDATCTIAGDQFLLWGGMTEQSNVLPSNEMVIYNLTSSKYMKQYTPPPFYKNLKPPPPLTRTTAPWPTDNPMTNKGVDGPSVPIGAAAGGAVAGLVLLGALVSLFFMRYRRRQRQGQTEEDKEPRVGGHVRRIPGLFGRQEGNQGRKEGPRHNPQQTNEEDELQRRLEMLESRQKEIDQTRQLLVQQHQESNPIPSLSQKRAPIALAENNAEVISMPVLLQQLSPDTVYSTFFSPDNLIGRRTVQAVLGPVEMFRSDSYEDDVPQKKESEMAQEAIEPIYGPSSPVNCAIPDVVYEPSSDVGMDWVKQQQMNNPHAILKPAED
jgi:hypothetical protein